MTLRLSVNRCGPDMNAGELRDAIADLTRLAGDVGEAIGMINASVAASPSEVRATASALRAHRNWILDQAKLLRSKLQAHEQRARDLLIHRAFDGFAVTLASGPQVPRASFEEKWAV